MAQAKWLSDKLVSRYNLQPWIFEPTRFRQGNRFPEDLDTEGPRPIGTVNWQDILSPEGVDLNPETVEVVPRGAFRGVCRELIENTVSGRQRMAEAKERWAEYRAASKERVRLRSVSRARGPSKQREPSPGEPSSSAAGACGPMAAAVEASLAPPFPPRKGNRKRSPVREEGESRGPRVKVTSPSDRTASPATVRRQMQRLPPRVVAQPRSAVIQELLEATLGPASGAEVKEQPRGAWQPSLAAVARSPSDRTRLRRALQGPNRAEAQAAAAEVAARPRPSMAPTLAPDYPRADAVAAEEPRRWAAPGQQGIPRRNVSPAIRRRGARDYPYFVAMLASNHPARRVRAKACVPPGTEGDRLLEAFAPFTQRGRFAICDTLGDIDWTAVQGVLALETEEYWVEAQQQFYSMTPLCTIRDAIESVGYPTMDAVLAGQFQHLGGTLLDLLVTTCAVRMGLRSTVETSAAVTNATY
ncbi:MAG: hypothetical protein GY772_15965, partial [bacterium]|nr:hypothetical protein [bacterium]